MGEPRKSLSFVIPVFNEADNLEPLVTEIRAAVDGLGYPYEVLLVDDGSHDGSLARMKELAARHPRVGYLALAHGGRSAALYAGFQQARGDFIVTLEADLQCDPADVPFLLGFTGAYDMVAGCRFEPRDALCKKFGRRWSHGWRNWVSGERLPDPGCSLKIMRAALVKQIKLFHGMHGFLPTLMRLEGGRVVEVKVRHRPRRPGKAQGGYRAGRWLEGVAAAMALRWMIKRHPHSAVREGRG